MDIDLEIFRQECRNFASLWVNKQKKQFDRFGINPNLNDS